MKYKLILSFTFLTILIGLFIVVATPGDETTKDRIKNMDWDAISEIGDLNTKIQSQKTVFSCIRGYCKTETVIFNKKEIKNIGDINFDFEVEVENFKTYLYDDEGRIIDVTDIKNSNNQKIKFQKGIKKQNNITIINTFQIPKGTFEYNITFNGLILDPFIDYSDIREFEDRFDDGVVNTTLWAVNADTITESCTSGQCGLNANEGGANPFSAECAIASNMFLDDEDFNITIKVGASGEAVGVKSAKLYYFRDSGSANEVITEGACTSSACTMADEFYYIEVNNNISGADKTVTIYNSTRDGSNPHVTYNSTDWSNQYLSLYSSGLTGESYHFCSANMFNATFINFMGDMTFNNNKSSPENPTITNSIFLELDINSTGMSDRNTLDTTEIILSSDYTTNWENYSVLNNNTGTFSYTIASENFTNASQIVNWGFCGKNIKGQQFCSEIYSFLVVNLAPTILLNETTPNIPTFGDTVYVVVQANDTDMDDIVSIDFTVIPPNGTAIFTDINGTLETVLEPMHNLNFSKSFVVDDAGTWKWFVNATDNLSLTSEDNGQFTITDTTIPTATMDSPLNQSVNAVSSLDINGTVSDGVRIDSIWYSIINVTGDVLTGNSSFTYCGDTFCSYNFSQVSFPLEQEMWARVYFNDTSNNEGFVENNLTITTDTSPPSLTLIQPVDTSDNSQEVNVTVLDNYDSVGILSCYYNITTDVPVVGTVFVAHNSIACDGLETFTTTVSAGSSQDFTLHFEAIDNSGNTANLSSVFTVTIASTPTPSSPGGGGGTPTSVRKGIGDLCEANEECETGICDLEFGSNNKTSETYQTCVTSTCGNNICALTPKRETYTTCRADCVPFGLGKEIGDLVKYAGYLAIALLLGITIFRDRKININFKLPKKFKFIKK